MEESEIIQIPTGKIYKDNAIWAIAFLGGPIAAGYIIAENFKVFNQDQKARATWIYTLIFTFLIFAFIFSIPDDIYIPNQLIPLIYTATAFGLMNHFQKENIAKHIAAGGETFNWGRNILVGLIGLVITFIPIFGYSTLTDSGIGSLDQKYYGFKQHEILFDKDNISEREIDDIADGLIYTKFFDDYNTQHLYVEKESSAYALYFSFDNSRHFEEEVVQPYSNLRDKLQELFPRHKIIFKFIEDDLDSVFKTIE